jgi:type III secretory pathway component EscT
MLPSWMFLARILPSLIPKSVRAGVALALTFICLPAGLLEFSNVLLGQASTWGVIKCIGGLLVGLSAGVVFYYFQAADSQKQAKDLEIISQYHKDNAKKFDVAWTSEDQTPKDNTHA